MENIKESVKAYIISEFFEDQNEQLNDDDLLMSTGIIDSISALQLVEFIEKKFNFEFQPHEVDHDNLNSLNLIETFIKSKVS